MFTETEQFISLSHSRMICIGIIILSFVVAVIFGYILTKDSLYKKEVHIGKKTCSLLLLSLGAFIISLVIFIGSIVGKSICDDELDFYRYGYTDTDLSFIAEIVSDNTGVAGYDDYSVSDVKKKISEYISINKKFTTKDIIQSLNPSISDDIAIPAGASLDNKMEYEKKKRGIE